ncbi:MAG: hypothetical protein Q9163_005260 [Psora crenata]
MPVDTISTRSQRSHGSTSHSGSPGGMNLGIPYLQQQQQQQQQQEQPSMSPSLPDVPGAMTMGSIIKHDMHNGYHTHSTPASLHDHLSSQPIPIGTAPRSLRPDMFYGLSPTGDSLYSSSDSCYSPLSDYLQAPQPLAQQYYGPDLVQRPHSAIEPCYQSMDASPLSVGPPTPVQGWNHYDSAALALPAETPCIPPQEQQQQQPQYRPNSSNSWSGTSNVPFYEMELPPQSTWPWMKMKL